jgi:hemerythrin-like domain-containing protein
MALPGTEKLAENLAVAVQANDPTGFLLADHEWTRDILDVFRASAVNGALMLSTEDVEELVSFIDLHIRREEDAYFPALESIVRQMRLGSTEEMYGEHDAIRICLEELQHAVARRDEVTSQLAALRRSLLVHFENEEELYFREPASRLTDEARREVITGFEALAKAGRP